MKKKQKIAAVLDFLFMHLLGLIMVFPLFWMARSSLMTQSEIFRKPMQWMPKIAQWKNYADIMTMRPFARWMCNSAFIVFFNVIGTMLTSSMAAFAFAKLKFSKADLLLKVFLATMMIPTQVTIIPLFVVMNKMSLINSYASVILPSIFRPFAVFLLVQQMRTIPNDYLDAASIDGASTFTVYFKVALPLCAPTLATLSITTFMESWNDYLWPLLMLTDKTKMTLPIALSTLNGQFATEYNVLMAGSLISMIPIILIYCFAQKYFQNGMMAGGIKG